MACHGVSFPCLVAIAYFMLLVDAFSNPLSPQQQQVFSHTLISDFKYPFLRIFAVGEFAATFWIGRRLLLQRFRHTTRQ